jgi:GTP pyrophosphokinase
MIVAMSRDIRVLLIKLADRLHNARTWGFVPPEKAQKKATETLEIYAPLAHRLGIQTIKSELEDLSFAVPASQALRRDREPREAAHAAARAVRAQRHRRGGLGPARTADPRAGDGPPKQLYSVYQKMVVRGREFDDIYDLIGIRILVGQRPRLLRRARRDPRAVDAAARPVQGLHRDAEVQPVPVAAHDGDRPRWPHGRDPDPHQRDAQQAEYGVAAHWKYKERLTGGKPDAKSLDADMAWLAHISDWQAETADPGEFLDSLRFEIGRKRSTSSRPRAA